MGLQKLAAKVAEYKTRLEEGKASKIEPKHVAKVLSKLRKKESDLVERIANAGGASDRDRLLLKLEIARDQIGKAQWLLEQLETERT